MNIIAEIAAVRDRMRAWRCMVCEDQGVIAEVTGWSAFDFETEERTFDLELLPCPRCSSTEGEP